MVEERYDAVVIGAGFYGLSIALHLREHLGARSVAVLEAGDEPMTRASFVNQARVHNGYHYPRSILTGLRSRLNRPRFKADWAEAVVDGFDHYYAIATRYSKTNARQFELFCRRIGATVEPAPAPVVAAFDANRIERVFRVEEPAFDSQVLRSMVLDRIERIGGVDLRLSTRAERVGGRARDLEVVSGARTFRAPLVIGAVYSGLNSLHAASGLPLLDLQHEVAEMAVVTLPATLDGAAFTVMDGPFFSIMPFPADAAHTLSHVRFTPHERWRESSAASRREPDQAMVKAKAKARTQYLAMRSDVVRYLPAARAMQYQGSMYEVKTVLARSSSDDSRPILFRADHGIAGYACVLGGKLDNIYDVLKELDRYGE